MQTTIKLAAVLATAALSTWASAQTAGQQAADASRDAARATGQAASAALTPGNQNAVGGSGTVQQRLNQPSDQPNMPAARTDSSTTSSSTTTTTERTARPARADRG